MGIGHVPAAHDAGRRYQMPNFLTASAFCTVYTFYKF